MFIALSAAANVENSNAFFRKFHHQLISKGSLKSSLRKWNTIFVEIFCSQSQKKSRMPTLFLLYSLIESIMTCPDHIEPEYYLTTNLNKEHMDECAYCLSHTSILDNKELEKCKLLTGHKHLLLCKACCEDGFKLRTYGLKNTAEAAAQKRKALSQVH